MNRARVNYEKYGISKKRYKELCGFCEQYPEWKKQIKDYSYIAPSFKTSEGRSIGNISDPTFNAAVRLEKYIDNCNLIEETAKEADAECWEFLIKAICYEVPPQYLISVEGFPVSMRTFYNRRRYFFYLLDKKKLQI